MRFFKILTRPDLTREILKKNDPTRPDPRHFETSLTRPVDRVTWCSKCHGSGRIGSGQEVFKISDGSGRVGSRGFQISWVGSGRVKTFSNLTGRVGSGQEVMKISRVGSGHDSREAGHSRVGPALPASCFLLTQRLLSYQYSIILLWYHNPTFKHRQIYIRMPLSIRTHYRQVIYHCGALK